MTPSKTIAILLRLTADWRREELQLCKQFGDVIIPQSMRERRIKETKAIDAAVEMINRLEAAERDVALKEKVIDALGSELNAVAKERDALLAKVERMEKRLRLILEEPENTMSNSKAMREMLRQARLALEESK